VFGVRVGWLRTKLVLRFRFRIVAEIKKGSPYSITERIVPELIPVLGS